MSFLAKGRKIDAQKVAMKLGIQGVENLIFLDLKNAIINSEGYDEEVVKGMLNTIIEERRREEDFEMEERKRKRELSKKEHELRMEEYKRKRELHDKEHELRMQEMQHEIQRIRKECERLSASREILPEAKEHLREKESLFKTPNVLVEINNCENIKGKCEKLPEENSCTEKRNTLVKRTNFENNIKKEKNDFAKPNEGQDKIIQNLFGAKEGHLKEACIESNTQVRVSRKRKRRDSKKRGQDEMSISLSNADHNWGLPVGETEGKFLQVKLGMGSQKFQGSASHGKEIKMPQQSVLQEEYLESVRRIFL